MGKAQSSISYNVLRAGNGFLLIFWWKQNYGLIGLALWWTISFVYFMGFFVVFFGLSLCAYESCLYSNNSKARTAALMESSKQPFFIIQTHNIMIKKNVNFNGALQDICRFSAYLSGYCLVNPENWLGFWHPKLMPEETCWNKKLNWPNRRERNKARRHLVTQKLSPLLGPLKKRIHRILINLVVSVDVKHHFYLLYFNCHPKIIKWTL